MKPDSGAGKVRYHSKGFLYTFENIEFFIINAFLLPYGHVLIFIVGLSPTSMSRENLNNSDWSLNHSAGDLMNNRYNESKKNYTYTFTENYNGLCSKEYVFLI